MCLKPCEVTFFRPGYAFFLLERGKRNIKLLERRASEEYVKGCYVRYGGPSMVPAARCSAGGEIVCACNGLTSGAVCGVDGAGGRYYGGPYILLVNRTKYCE